MDNDLHKWQQVLDLFKDRFGKDADVHAILFVVGLREMGMSGGKIEKETKMDLMNLGFCRVAQLSGYFLSYENDQDGWPLWQQAKPLPKMTTKEQEAFIKEHVIRYCEHEGLI
jgi:hypothetical protein